MGPFMLLVTKNAVLDWKANFDYVFLTTRLDGKPFFSDS
ncbi:hypothetical protein LROSL3_0639 [Furfurilactobacillus rossiae]|jgi:hypothetical protein|nr:hypothetical protein LROSL2_0638 [Furfurilactobacillus rossiae]QLE68420.1 hypothetical protein LROSL3_0639 [Furfurilactobacillus rossiae]